MSGDRMRGINGCVKWVHRVVLSSPKHTLATRVLNRNGNEGDRRVTKEGSSR